MTNVTLMGNQDVEIASHDKVVGAVRASGGAEPRRGRTFRDCAFWFPIVLFCVFAASGAENLRIDLKTLGVRNANNALIVLGTDGAWSGSPGWTKGCTYDGNVNTRFEPPDEAAEAGNVWAGYQLSKPATVSYIRFLTRKDSYAVRALGCIFQGANTEDFSDAEDLYTITNTVDEMKAGWCEVKLNPAAAGTPKTYTYLRVIAPNPSSVGHGCNGGNFHEVEFYGYETYPTETEPPVKPSAPDVTLAFGKFYFNLTKPDDAHTIRFQGRTAGSAGFTTIASIFAITASSIAVSYANPFGNHALECRIIVENEVGSSVSDTVTVPLYWTLNGDWIGTEGAYNNGTMKGEMAFDGKFDTYFDAPKESGCWTGRDLRRSYRVTGVEYVARKDWLARMEGGKFQISDTPDFSANVTTLHTVSTAGMSGQIPVRATFEGATGRYVRYLGPNGGSCNVADIAFLTDDASGDSMDAPADFTCVPDASNTNVPVLAWSAPYQTCSSSVVYRAHSPGGPWEAMASVPYGTYVFTNTLVRSGVRYYFRVGFACEGADPGPMSAERYAWFFIGQLERATPTTNGLRAGFTAIGYHHTYNNSANTAEKLFDGSTSSVADYVSVSGGDKGDIKAGVDFGEPYVIDRFEYYPREDCLNRVAGMVLAGSNDASDPANVSWTNVAHVLSAKCIVPSAAWYAQDTTNKAPCRYVYVMKKDTTNGNGNFYANVAELRLYGWRWADVKDLVYAPETVEGVWRRDGHVQLDWTHSDTAASYRVDRRIDDATEWETVATDLTGTTWTDGDSRVDGRTYVYRVVSVNGDNVGYSDDVTMCKVPRGTVIIIK